MWCIPLEFKYGATILNEFSTKKVTTSKQKLLKLEDDRGKERYISIVQNFLKVKKMRHYSRFTNKGPSITERVNRTIRNLFKQPVSEKGIVDWLTELSSVIKKYNNTIHNSTKVTPFKLLKNQMKK